MNRQRLSVAGLLLLLLKSLLAIQCLATASVNSGNCESRNITRNLAENSWQTSSYSADTCFANGSIETWNSFRYFHSKNSTANTDDGYQWFVLQLKESVRVEAVTLLARRSDDDLCKNQTACKSAFNRHNHVEIFTTSEPVDFGNNTCSSSDISSQFNNDKQNWIRCGMTFSDESAVKLANGNLTAICDDWRLVKSILFRRSVNLTSKSEFDSCMSFGGIVLQMPQINYNAAKAKVWDIPPFPFMAFIGAVSAAAATAALIASVLGIYMLRLRASKDRDFDVRDIEIIHLGNQEFPWERDY